MQRGGKKGRFLTLGSTDKVGVVSYCESFCLFAAFFVSSCWTPSMWGLSFRCCLVVFLSAWEIQSLDWTKKKKSSPIIVLLFIGCLCQTVGSCYLCINCVIQDMFLQSPPPIPKLSRFPYEHVSVNRTCFSYSVSLFVFFLQKWLFAFSSFHVIILLVHLLSISRAWPYLATAVCSGFVTYCLGCTEGYFVFRVLQQADLSSPLTHLEMIEKDNEKKKQKGGYVSSCEVCFFCSKLCMQDAEDCTKVLAETWFSQCGLLFCIIPTGFETNYYMVDERLKLH